MHWALFLLPFCLFAGAAAQAIGLYLLAIALPIVFILTKRSPMSVHAGAFPFLALGFAFLAMWAIFPVANFINFLLTPGATIADLAANNTPRIGKALRSQLSSSFLVTALALIGCGLRFQSDQTGHPASLPHLTPSQPGRNPTESLFQSRVFRYFSWGFFSATVALSFYVTLQHLTGYDYRSPTKVLLPEHRMAGGNYRIFGLYGHPLSMAGVGLACFSFWWTVFWAWVQSKLTTPPSKNPRPIGLLPLAFLGSSALHFYFTLASGGRTATVVAILVFIALPLTMRLPKRSALFRLGGVVLATGVALSIVVTSGILDRFGSLMASLQGQEEGPNRFSFWKVYWQMIQEKPLVGHGPAWLDLFAREAYYNRLGYETLSEKYNAHNVYLESLANVGILGTLALLGALLAMGWRLRGAFQLNPSFSLFGKALAIAFAANALHALTQNVFFDSNVTYAYLGLFWVGCWLFCSAEEAYPARKPSPVPLSSATPAPE